MEAVQHFRRGGLRTAVFDSTGLDRGLRSNHLHKLNYMRKPNKDICRQMDNKRKKVRMLKVEKEKKIETERQL